MIAYALIAFLWFFLAIVSFQIVYLNRFATETIENLRTLNQLVLKQTGGQNGKDE